MVKPIVHVPAATLALHDKAPAVMVTVPVGVAPEPATVKLIVTMSPATEGLGEVDVICSDAPLLVT